MEERTRISIQKIKDNAIKTAVFNALNDINANSLFKKIGMKILIKPNILMAKPAEDAVDTHPEVVRSVIQWIKQFKPAKIYVCDSSGGQKPGITEESIKVSGIGKVCEEEGAECIPFEKTKRKYYKIENPLELEGIYSSELLKEVDLIVNVPKIKTHGQCLLTCSIKNMFGTVLLSNKARVHANAATLDRFTSALVDIYSVSKPQLTIVDGYLCQEGQGPSKGDIVKLGIILAGFDGVALDSVICKIIGFDISDVLYLKKAESRNLGTTKLENIELLGEDLESVKRSFKKPKIHPVSIPVPHWLANYIGKTVFKARVEFDKKKCRLCGTCWDNCPVKAINPPEVIKKGNVPKWNKKKCITCYCCVELCPYQAVDFKLNFAKNFMLSWLGLSCIIIILAIIGIIFWLI